MERFTSPSSSRRCCRRSSPGSAGASSGASGAHTVTILGVALSFALSVYVLKDAVRGMGTDNGAVYTWLVSDGLKLEVGFLIDHLSAMMMVVVTFVSLMVHIYTVGYMHDDPGLQRFFSYISLFTFSMLMLVMSNNFMQLFFGWEGVGLVSYLLIGFWYTRPTAIAAAIKAFVVNRVGDFGFVLGIAAVLYYTGSLDYDDFVRARRADRGQDQIHSGGARLVGADLHLHLPVHRRDGQVGAGSAARVAARRDGRPDADLGADPRGDHGDRRHLHGGAHVAAVRAVADALSFVLIIGATTAFFMGSVGIVNNDIKRVIAYSTLSQLGYMTVALGVSPTAPASSI
jgi:NADH-quinone oxidoreductase subunit L